MTDNENPKVLEMIVQSTIASVQDGNDEKNDSKAQQSERTPIVKGRTKLPQVDPELLNINDDDSDDNDEKGDNADNEDTDGVKVVFAEENSNGLSPPKKDRHKVTCKRNHILKEKSFDAFDGMKESVCSECQAPHSNTRYGCDLEMCNYVICPECFENRKNKTIFCRKGHELIKGYCDNWMCDGCKKLKNKELSFQCRACDHGM